MITNLQTVAVTATSQADPTKSASSTITLAPVSVSVAPASGTLYIGQTEQFSATVMNTSNTGVSWSLNPPAGTISAAGLYTAPASIASQQTVAITATSLADPTKSASVSITLVPVTVSVGPGSTTLFVRQTQAFVATVGNSPDQTVTWSISPAGTGTISASGVYTAPASIATQQMVTITATSNADVSKSATATVTLLPVMVSVAPTSASLIIGQSQAFTATVANATNTGVTWSTSPAGVGAITAGGVYTAPASIATQQTVTITATSQADSTKSASVSVTLNPVVMTVGPATTTLSASQTQQFSASVTNAPDTSVTWSISPAGTGTISAAGLYTAPATIFDQTTATVTATSVADPSKSATATLTLRISTISVTPQAVTLSSGQSQQFTSSSTSVTWSISPAGVGTVTSTGLYTAPASVASEQTITVTATSVADTSKAASGTVTLKPVIVTVTPPVITMNAGQSQAFTATVTNSSNTGVTWSISPAGVGTITPAGLYTAPASIASQQTVTITATSQADPSKTASATVTLVPVSVSVTPSTSTLYAGQTQAFTATVTNAGNSQVTWSISPAGVGTVTPSGLYTAPASIATQQTVTVIAASQVDPARSASATVTLVPVAIVSITPQTATLSAAQTQQFTATVSNAANTAVTWTLTPAVGTISASGLYTAPDCIYSQRTVTVTATSVADATKSTSATITLITSNTFSYQSAIVVDHTKVPNSDQTNFPMLVSVTDPSLATTANGGHVVSPNGYDIVFASDVTCRNTLNFEIESWTPATGQLVAWVQIPLLSHTSDTVIQLCYGNSSLTADQSHKAQTWDVNHLGVYHLGGGATLSAADSTANGNNGTVSGAAPAAGKLDGSAQFNGTSNYIGLPQAAFGAYPTNYSVTVSAWFKTGSSGVILSQTTPTTPGSGPSGWVPALYVDTAGKVRASVFWHGSVRQIISANSYNDNAWHFVGDTFSSGTEKLYVDGQLAGSASVTENSYSASYSYFLGTGFTNAWRGLAGGWVYFNGLLDEVRVSNTARSSDWLAAEYNNESSPGSFYTIFPENARTISVSPLISGLYASQSQQFTATLIGACAAPVNWSVSPAGAGAISSTGLYSAPAAIAIQQTVTITAATDAGVAGSATVTLEPPVVVSVNPPVSTVTANQRQQFTATVTNAINTAVTWSISPTGAGAISATGLYTAPASIAAPQTVTVTATSVADPLVSASAAMTLTNASAFRYHRTIVIDHTKVPNTDQTNFPVLISGTYGYLASASNGGKVQSPNGYDIIFTSDCDGLNRLEHQMERYDPATGEFVAWVRIPTVSHAADTAFYMSYGNANILSSPENPAAVWDSNYQAVWHLNGTATPSATDSTANAYNGTLISGPAAAPGQIGGAANFNGSGQYIEIGNLGPRPGRGTVSLWVNAATRAGNPNPFDTGAFGNNCRNIRFEVHGDGTFDVYVGNQASDCIYNYVRTSLTTSFVPFAWHYAVLTFDTGPGSLSVYYDGQLAKTVPAGFWPPNFEDVKIGMGPDLSRGWVGQVDEVRMSTSVRPADWIATEYNNQSSPATFYTISSEDTGAITVTPASPALYAGRTQQFAGTQGGSCVTPPLNWSVLPTGAGTISAGGLYTAPASVAAMQTVTVKATSQSDASVTGAATVTLLPPASVGVAPAAATVFNGGTLQFTASVSNAANTAVTWSVSPAGSGTINSAGLYTAPASIAAQQTASVIATSVADPTKSGAAAVTLMPGQGITVSGGSFTYALNLIAQSVCRRPHVAPVVNAGPDQSTYMSGSAATATVTGTVIDYSLKPGYSLSYTWSLASGPAAAQFGNAHAISTPITFSRVGTYTLQFSVDDGVSTSSALTHVSVLNAPVGNGNTVLITPTVNGPTAVQTPMTLLVTVTGFFSDGVPVHVQVSGANPQSADLNSGPTSRVNFTYWAVNPGTDAIVATATICCWVSPVSNTATVTWVTGSPVLFSSPVTGRFFTNDGSGAFNTPASQQPIFTQVFPNINFNAAAGGVSSLTRPFTDIETDPAGNALGTIVAQGNGYPAGVGALYNFSAVFTGSLNIPSPGQYTFAFTSDDAFLFGVGGGAARVSGPQTNTPSTTAFQNYAVMGGVNQRSAAAQSSIVVSFPAAGVYPYEVDYAKGGDKNLTLTMQSGGVPIPAAALLTLTPSTVPPITQGQIQTLTLQATDARGIALSNLLVTVNISGPNQQSRTLTTDGTGQVSFSYAGSPFLTGADQVQASATVSGAAAYSNVVAVAWNTGINQAPVVSAGANQAVTLPAPAMLNGSASDDGLPLGGSLAITWAKLSGPGTVTFDNPNQAVTGAVFSAPGTYLLQLLGSDGALSASATVSIAVNASTTWSAGWIASPLDKSAVSGAVPITVGAGITLTGGTLTYYPASDLGAVTVLNPNTTGTGQIGAFDATTLKNGAYWIELRATNSQGATQTNLALVMVAGDYKPGRVTATITDLTVAAPGLPIKIERTYDSLTRPAAGDFGYGWNLGVSIQTDVGPMGDVTLTLNGRRRTFYFTPAANPIFSYWYVPAYTAETGLYGSLVNTGDNCNGVMQRIGNAWQCAVDNAGSMYQPTGYRYTDPYGRVYTIGANGSLQSVQDLNGNTLTVTAAGISSSTGLNVPFVRDAQGRITKITDPLGKDYLYTYNAAGELASVTYPGIATPAQYGYDATHLLTSEIDQRGNPAGTTTYYPDGKLKSVTDAVGNLTQYGYDLANRTTTVTNPDGGTVITVADAYGQPLSVIDPLARTTTNTYDANHNLLTTTDPLGKTTTYTYDARGFRTSLKDPLNNTWSAGYNQFGGPTAVTNPLNQTQNVGYDANFRISAITDSLGSVAQFTYNAAGLPLTLRDARGNTSSYVYD